MGSPAADPAPVAALSRHLPVSGRGARTVAALLLRALGTLGGDAEAPLALRLWRLWVLGGFLAIAAGRWCRPARGAPTHAAAQPLAGCSTDVAAAPTQVAEVPKANGAKRCQPRFFELLRPEGGGLIVAAPEVAALVAASLANAWLMLYKAWLMREFVTGQNLGDWRRWLAALAKFPVATLGMALLSQTTKYTQARVSLLWRRAATRRLMRGYFSGLNYYRILHDSTLHIADPDVRICSDVKTACDALTGVFTTGLSGITMAIFSSAALCRRRGVAAMLLPYLYSFVFVPLNFFVMRPDWSAILKSQQAYSRYQQALTRCQLHGESIAMLHGGDFERGVLDSKAEAWSEQERRSWRALAYFDWVQHYVSNTSMPGVWQSVASFGAAFIAVLAAGPDAPQLDPGTANEEVVVKYGANVSDFWQIMYGVRGASTFLSALEAFQRSKYSLQRIEQLQAVLAELEEQGGGDQSSLRPGRDIAFEDVTIVTPTGTELLSGLSFTLEPGQHMVITGHNGAGKSSIFRCLGGLWPIARGRITCPSSGVGENGLHGAAYYLPQKPANILGTLSDQLTYPMRVEGGLPEVELRRWLSYVELEYLVDAEAQAGTLQTDSDWAVKLSLGEQQRLGIARLFYHRPQYAILDECTSAVSKDMERHLFEVARELGMSCITITHRPALQEHHHRMLRLTGRLAEDRRGWELVDLRSALPECRPLVANEAEAHQRIERLHKHLGKRVAAARPLLSQQPINGSADPATPSAPSRVPSGRQLVLERWPTELARLSAALQLGAMDPPSLVRAAALAACLMARPQITWEIFRAIGGSVSCAMCHDVVGLWAELAVNLTYAAGLACLDRLIERLAQRLMLDSWERIVGALHRQALDDDTLRRLGRSQSKVENPMQRIAETRALLEDLKGLLFTTGRPIVQMLYFLPLLLRGGGVLPLGTLVCLFLTHLAVRRYWMPNFRAIAERQGEFEDRFQVAQTRLRHVAEPVAFSGGGDAERRRVEEHFERLCEHRLSSLRQEFMYNFLTEFFLVYDNLPIWFHRVLSFNFALRNLPPSGASPTSAVQNYLYDRTITNSLVGVQSLAAFPEALARADGRASRLLALRAALEGGPGPPPAEVVLGDDSRIVVRDLDLKTPRGECLARGVAFQVEHGSPLLVTGPNASGKTSLARVLLGLWPPGGKAFVAVPRGLMIVTQRPYLAPGTLGDQVAYPRAFAAGTDEGMALRALRAVGLEYLLERAQPEGWAHSCAWEDILSGGEQQRLALSRTLFHQPSFAIFDECTAMVAAEAEEHLYEAAVHDFGITPLTLSQRVFLPQLHPHELRLGDVGERGWTLQPTVP